MGLLCACVLLLCPQAIASAAANHTRHRGHRQLVARRRVLAHSRSFTGFGSTWSRGGEAAVLLPLPIRRQRKIRQLLAASHHQQQQKRPQTRKTDKDPRRPRRRRKDTVRLQGPGRKAVGQAKSESENERGRGKRRRAAKEE